MDLVKLLVKTFKNGNKVMVCGNGGSHCDAMHFAEEFTGRYKKDRPPLPAMALGTNPAHLTCVGNDYGFEYVFSREVEAFGQMDDVLIAISTSGNSRNILMAVGEAKKRGMVTVGLTGESGGLLATQVDIVYHVPFAETSRIQEGHIQFIHHLIEAVERMLFPDLYEDKDLFDSQGSTIIVMSGKRRMEIQVPDEYAKKIWDNLPFEYRTKAVDEYVPSGKRVKAFRNKHNMSQAQLAKKSGVSRSTIALIEVGKRPLSKKLAQKIAPCLECKPEDLL